ncbi:MAG: hypothetical protein ACMXYA_02235 [Candidatus Woesearchaeota archaeon]
MKIQEWTKHMFDMKNSFKKIYTSITVQDEQTVLLQTKSEKKQVFCAKKLEKKENYDLFSCENTKENIKILYDQWELFSQKPHTIFFVNLKTGSYWAINPQNHQKIVEKSKLYKSLLTLYENSLV